MDVNEVEELIRVFGSGDANKIAYERTNDALQSSYRLIILFIALVEAIMRA